MKKTIGISMICLGIAMLGTSFAWHRLFPVESLWTEEKATQLTQTAIDFHGQYHTEAAANKKDAPPSERGRQKLEQLESDFARVDNDLRQAQNFRDKMPGYLRLAAAGLLIVGAFLCRQT